MSKYSAITIIYNPNSTGSSKTAGQDLIKELRIEMPDIPIEIVPTSHAGHAEKLAYQHAKKTKLPLIISSSGDGGYHEVVNGALRAQAEGAQPICAVLAAGNANDHRRTLKKNPLVEAITKKLVTKIDVLEATFTDSKGGEVKRYAHSYIGLGLTPVVAVELNRHTLSAFKDLWIVLKTFYKFRPFRIRVDTKSYTLDSILFANISQMAKILTLSKDSKPDDGLFEVIVFPHAHKLRLIGRLFKASTVGLNPKKHYKDFEFTVLKKMPMQMDGEVTFITSNTPVKIKSLKRVLSTIH